MRTIQIDGDIVNALAATVARSAEFVLQAPFDPQQGGPLYDHAAGPAAQFWLRVDVRS